ncbi:peroxidase family protein [Lentzea guizhouensis]|nr:peroxidase family protein [Lentzea guizhouensis]
MRRTVALVTVGAFLGSGAAHAGPGWFEVQSLDGRGNNRAHPEWGAVGEAYLRVAPARYADGAGQPVAEPNARYVSSRIFADGGQNLLSDRQVSQWAQFMDHTFGLREDTNTDASIPWDNDAPPEHVRNDLGSIPMRRSGVVEGLTPYEQKNIVSSYLDGFAVYGGEQGRLAWLRDGAKLLLPKNMLPRRKVTTDVSRYTEAQLEALRAKGATVTVTGEKVEIGMLPFQPDLVDEVQIGPLLQSFGAQPENRNDEVVDEDTLRSIVFLIPGCQPRCLTAVVDVSALDVERGRDHGIAIYNDLRRAYGLTPQPSFRAISGETTESFPADPELTPGDEINDPDSLGHVSPGVRRTTTAARLKAIYGDLSGVDAIVGMMAEPRLPGSEFGELQHAIWKKQFEALRDGDRFFHANDPALRIIKARYGIDHRRTLGDVIAANTDVPCGDLAYNVFRTHPPVG